jgi:hypothetical protein
MPKKKKAAAKVTKKIIAKQIKKVSSRAAKAKTSLNKKSLKKTVARAPRAKSKVFVSKIEPMHISEHDQIIHAAETYAVSIDEIISSGNREFKMMQTNGRGQEITAPKIEPKQIEAAQPKVIEENIVEESEEIITENILSEADKKALALVRAKLESSTVMIRSVSPLQTPFAHSSRNFVTEIPKKSSSRAPLVFLSSAAIIFAAFVVAVVVTKSGNLSDLTKTPLLKTPVVQKVAGAETSPQQYEAADFTFSYPGTWYASQTKNVVTLADSQKASASKITLTSNDLGGKSFQDWLANSNYKNEKVTPAGNTNPTIYQAVSGISFVTGKKSVIVVQGSSNSQAIAAIMKSVVSSLAFLK